MNSALFTIVPIFIAICAIFVFGGVITTFIAAMRHRNTINRMTQDVIDQSPAKSPSPASETRANSQNFSCQQCGAALNSETEISPSGDFKCGYCNSWSNVNKG